MHAFLFLAVSHNQCSQLPTDPARSQHIYIFLFNLQKQSQVLYFLQEFKFNHLPAAKQLLSFCLFVEWSNYRPLIYLWNKNCYEYDQNKILIHYATQSELTFQWIFRVMLVSSCYCFFSSQPHHLRFFFFQCLLHLNWLTLKILYNYNSQLYNNVQK